MVLVRLLDITKINMSPLVSIIMNCRNGEKFLQESLNSVIQQTYKNWELIFVDNRSKDNSKNIFEKYGDSRFKYIYLNEEVNLGTARQEALKNCSGDFISFLDTDDLWFEKKLEKQMEFFQDKDVGMVISNTVFFSDKKSKKFYKKDPPSGFVFFDLLKNYFISLETLVCKKEYLKKISFEFDKNFSMISDLDLTIRLSQICKLSYCPLVLSKWRIHSSSDSWNKKNLFFLEKMKFIEKFKLKNSDINQQKFIEFKKIFIKNANFSLLFNQIEFGEKRLEIIKNLNNKNFHFYQFCILLFLILIPFNKKLIKFYRKIFSITP